MPDLNIYTVRDNKADSYLPPFFASNEEVGTRMFYDAVVDPQNILHKHPEDFSLWCIGTYSLLTGQIQSETPYCVLKALDVMRIYKKANAE